MAKRRGKRVDLGRPAAGPVTVIKADGTREKQAALPPSRGASPDSQYAFGTHSKAYRRKASVGSKRSKSAGAGIPNRGKA